jgi:hypothetical protein
MPAHSRTESPHAIGHDGFEFLVPREVSSQVEPLDIGLLNPGNSQVEAAFGHSRRLGMRG